MEEVKRLDAAEYQMIQDGLMLIGNLMEQYDLDAFILTAEITHTIAPIVDPTLYRKALYNGGVARLDKIIEIARKAREFQKASREFKTQVESEVQS